MARFIGARLKIKRADEHIAELDASIQAFVDGDDYYRLGVEKDAEGRTLVTITPKELPEDVPCIIGDAIHNLHSALDFMFWDAVIAFGETPDKDVRFDCRTCADDVVGTLKARKTGVFSPPLIAYIRDTMRPYTGPRGNGALCALHDLDIMDKHRLLIPIRELRVGGIASLLWRSGPKTFHASGSASFASTTNTICMTLDRDVRPEDVQFDAGVKPTLSILFDDGNVFKNQPVVPTLRQLSQLVAETVDAFENLCP